MIYIVIFVLMAVAGWISYEMGNEDYDNNDKTKTPK